MLETYCRSSIALVIHSFDPLEQKIGAIGILLTYRSSGARKLCTDWLGFVNPVGAV